MSQVQLSLDFTPRVDTSKKTQRITVTCSDEFKEFFDKFCNSRGLSPSQLGYHYILEGMKNDLGNMFFAQPHLDESLRELLQKKF